jgi:hypothetical protein
MVSYNLLEPRDLPGKFRVETMSFGARYAWREKWEPWLVVKVDNSTNTDGTDRGADVLSLAMHYNF